MTQLVITITDPNEASLIKKLLAKFNSVTISMPTRKSKTGLDEVVEDVKAGRVTHYESVEEFFVEKRVASLKSAINEGIESGIISDFDPQNYLETIKTRHRNG